jgi:hypothetical protein
MHAYFCGRLSVRVPRVVPGHAMGVTDTPRLMGVNTAQAGRLTSAW